MPEQFDEIAMSILIMLALIFDIINRKTIKKTISFPMPSCSFEHKKDIALQLAAKNCPRGWQVDTSEWNVDHYFELTKFFHTKNGIEYCTVSISKSE